MSAFPPIGGNMFEGVLYGSWELPWYFAPKLMLLQFTIPAILLGLGGVILGVVQVKSRHKRVNYELLIVGLWLILPLFFNYINRTPLYENFRQLLFVTPPIFIFAGLAIDYALRLLRNTFVQAAVIIVILLPGIVGIIDSHPYEYMYYNQIVGGISGADGVYETDYWCTSMRDASEYLNEHAPDGAVIAVLRNLQLVDPYLREDLHSYQIRYIEDISFEKTDYVVVCDDYSDQYLGDMPIFHRVTKDGVTLTTVWEIE